MKIVIAGTLFKEAVAILPEADKTRQNESHRWVNDKDKVRMELDVMSDEGLAKLTDFLDGAIRNGGGRTVVLARNQLRQWIELKSSPDGEVTVPKLENFPSAMKIWMMKKANSRYLFAQNEDGNMVPYFVSGVSYNPPTKYSGASVSVGLECINLAIGQKGRKGGSGRGGDEHATRHETILSYQIVQKTVSQVMAEKGWYIETEERMKTYMEEMERFNVMRDRVGLQLNVTGKVYANDNSWYGHRTFVPIERNGEPAKTVLDPPDGEGITTATDAKFWDDMEEGESEQDSQSLWQLPVHPYLRVFDLEEHSFYAAHINNVETYKYHTDIGDKLVLPQDVKDLLEVLVEQAGMNFTDIVSGKTGGVIVLCQGTPGTGKTLTAEVYSEVMQKPLYKVQASQLGVHVKELEDTLKEVLDRAERWNAILLLDEADVYVRARGNEIEQNAIVGVFLRVLEYYRGVLFMTTNRGTEIDDAIVSRLTARVTYSTPSPEDRNRIWHIIAFDNGIMLSDDDITKLVKDLPETSGRDIKNLLKLAKLVSLKGTGKVTAELIKRLNKFKQ
jgi:hypothetical protein